MIRKAIYILSLLLICSGLSFGQDIHFSQYKSMPIMLNPAQTGFFQAKMRVSANQRSQWRSVTVPFNTFAFAADMQVYRNRYSKDIIGLGLMSYYDKAGDSEFGTTSAAISLSYIKALNALHNHYISFGASMSYNDRSYNYSALVFGNQFNGEMFDPSMYHGETFLNRGYKFFDYNAGVHWFLQSSKELNWEAGVTMAHLTTPRQSMLDDSQIRLDRRFTAYVGAEYQLPHNRILSPGLYFSRQGTYTELIFGANFRFDQYFSNTGFSVLHTGLYFRTVDAAILMVGMDYKQLTFMMSYDINYSGLRKASDYRGGMEFSLVYMINKKKRSNNKKSIKCPDPF